MQIKDLSKQNMKAGCRRKKGPGEISWIRTFSSLNLYRTQPTRARHYAFGLPSKYFLKLSFEI
jgi:hypothetical protein